MTLKSKIILIKAFFSVFYNFIGYYFGDYNILSDKKAEFNY